MDKACLKIEMGNGTLLFMPCVAVPLSLVCCPHKMIVAASKLFLKFTHNQSDSHLLQACCYCAVTYIVVAVYRRLIVTLENDF